MPDSPKKPHPLIALRIEHKNAYDAVAMLVYLFAVYGWGLWICPLGRDFQAIQPGHADLPFLVRQVFAAEVAVFGEHAAGYHLVNIALMYACMLLIYYFVNQSVRGLWWFGTLAASLFMANPVHSEAMHNISGVADLLPCLAGLAVLAGYAWNVAAPHPTKLGAAALAAVFASGAYAECATLGLVIAVYEWLVVPMASRSLLRGVAVGGAALASAIACGTIYPRGAVDLGQMFGPLYLVFYPIGFLPKTVETFSTRPWTAWLAAAVVLVAIGLMYRKARRAGFLFAVVAMLLLRAAPNARPVDMVHMVGGGQLLLANAMFVLGFVAIVFRIMDHPRWRVPMITITTTLVIVFFAMQWRSIAHWREAGRFVRDFRAQARAAAANGPVGVLPDYRYYRGAPLCLSDSLAEGTSILPVHPQSLGDRAIAIESWGANGGTVVLPSVPDAPLFTYFPNAERIAFDTPLKLREVWGPTMADATFTVSQREDGALIVSIVGDGLPAQLAP